MRVLEHSAMTARHVATEHPSLLSQAIKLLQMLLYASFAAALVCFLRQDTCTYCLVKACSVTRAVYHLYAVCMSNMLHKQWMPPGYFNICFVFATAKKQQGALQIHWRWMMGRS